MDTRLTAEYRAAAGREYKRRAEERRRQVVVRGSMELGEHCLLGRGVKELQWFHKF